MPVETTPEENIDAAVVRSFGEEWSRHDQSALVGDEWARAFDSYFGIFPWDVLPAGAKGFDLGCGSGRWAKGVAPRVGTLHCIDPSEAALDVARRNLVDQQNCRFHLASVAEIPLENESMDFGYSLGVLHHVPDTAAGIRACAAKLKPGAPFLIYLYYAFDNRPAWFRRVWQLSNAGRVVISRLPRAMRGLITDIISGVVYWPLARLARVAEKLGVNVSAFPLSAYRNRGFYSMRTDALDRFGTRLEQRFTRRQIEQMLEQAGLINSCFSDREPFWCAVAFKRRA